MFSSHTVTAAEAQVLAAAPFVITELGRPLDPTTGELQVAAIQSAIAKGWLAQTRVPGAREYVLTPTGLAVYTAALFAETRIHA